MTNICPRTSTCPLFNDNLLKRKESAETYKALYCRSDVKYKDCKRYIVVEKVGAVADFVMPNSSYSVEEIIERMKSEGLIR